jgi:formylglycine-generating enzyme required for sulfatase activity
VAVAEMPIPNPADYQRRWAKQLGLPVEMTDARGMWFVFVPPGTFTMGDSRTSKPEKPRRVTIRRAFYLGRTEVTHAQFAAFIDDTRYVTRAEAHGAGTAMSRHAG